jgi:hypothetical protein
MHKKFLIQRTKNGELRSDPHPEYLSGSKLLDMIKCAYCLEAIVTEIKSTNLGQDYLRRIKIKIPSLLKTSVGFSGL